MSAVTADRNTKMREGLIGEPPLAANAKGHVGTLQMRNSSGYAVTGADTASCKFAGIVREAADNTGGADGAKTVKVYRTGEFKLPGSGTIARSDIGSEVEIKDNQTIALAAGTTNHVKCGKLIDIASDGELWFRIDGYAFG